MTSRFPATVELDTVVLGLLVMVLGRALAHWLFAFVLEALVN